MSVNVFLAQEMFFFGKQLSFFENLSFLKPHTTSKPLWSDPRNNFSLKVYTFLFLELFSACLDLV